MIISSTLQQEPVQLIRNYAILLGDDSSHYTSLFEMIGDACVVLIGDSSCRSGSFSRIRGEMTNQLLHYFGFHAVVIENAWQSASQAKELVASLAGLMNQLSDQRGEPAKIVLWANNYNAAGEYREAETDQEGICLNKLVREQWQEVARFIDFSVRDDSIAKSDTDFYIVLRGNLALRERLLPESFADAIMYTGPVN